ncbi:MAG: synthase, delta subunit [Acidimicrobiales bacterium]|nr:synthase, delta subunit [Acidimicrobiales bacterium]
MADRVDGWVVGLFEVARAEGQLEAVEDDLFRFARALEGSDELRSVLTDEAVPASRRLGVVTDLLGNRASPLSAALVSAVVAAGRSRQLPAIADGLVRRAAASRERVLAEVRSAVPLDDDQRTRMAEALGRATGKAVEVKVVIDPEVLGGVVAQVGDTVIDGSVRSRLDELRERIGGRG